MKNHFYSSDVALQHIVSEEIDKQTEAFFKSGGKVSVFVQGDTGKNYDLVSAKSKKGAKAGNQSVRARIKTEELK